ncbi:MAG TPA: hypothetical protein VJX23_16770 [Candidatus Binataceae bacterium]|nr:hypothetical protein [Candidatus Binataceae bacterium]
MLPLAIGSIIFVCTFGGALLGMFLHNALPEHHLSAESKDAVKVGVGLIGLMAALVLGLLVTSAKNSFDTKSHELTDMAAKMVLIDRLLAHYGPETKDIRRRLRESVTRTLDALWPQDGSGPPDLEPAASGSEALYDAIQDLSPKDEAQRTIQSQALSIGVDIGHTRWLLFEQSGSSISTPFLVVLVFWLTVIFISFGLFAPRNATVVATFLVCALSISGAIFLILELDRPFAGLIQLSSAPLRVALAHLGR